MGTNPELRFETGSIPLRANGAWLAKRAVVATTDGSNSEQRGAPAAAVSQHATFTSIEKFIGIAPIAVADGAIGEVIVKGRTRVVGGGAIVAGAYVIWGATGKFTSYTHDAAKFACLAGIAASDCSGDDAEFDLFIDPKLVGPANATGVDMTLSGILTALTLAITGNGTIGGTLGVTGTSTLAAIIATTLALSGNLTASARVLQKQGADVASANNLVLGSDGNTFEITGTTEIQLLSNLTWQNGAIVNLLFTSNPTVKHATATSGTNITMLLAAAGDFVASSGDVLSLMLCEIGGTQAWREVGRTVI